MIRRSFVLPSVLIFITLWGLLSLGFWQLDRAEEKRSIETAIVLAQSNPARLVVQIDDLLDKEHYPVLLKGRYDTDKQFIYDNQIVKGNAGYYVLTPFVLKGNTAILINRGFVLWQDRRQKLANIKVGDSERIIKVKLITPKQRIQLKQTRADSSFPMLIQSLDMKQLSQLSGYQIIPMIAQLDVGADNGFYRQWLPFYGSVDKHLGYALQWFLMALALVIIGIYLLIKNKKNA